MNKSIHSANFANHGSNGGENFAMNESQHNDDMVGLYGNRGVTMPHQNDGPLTTSNYFEMSQIPQGGQLFNNDSTINKTLMRDGDDVVDVNFRKQTSEEDNGDFDEEFFNESVAVYNADGDMNGPGGMEYLDEEQQSGGK